MTFRNGNQVIPTLPLNESDSFSSSPEGSLDRPATLNLSTALTNRTNDELVAVNMLAPCDIVIANDGPIGLLHAWALNKLNSNLRIVMLEKLQALRQNYTVSIEPAQLRALQQVTNSKNDKEMNSLIETLEKNSHIRLLDLEDKLRSMLDTLNSSVRKGDELCNSIEYQAWNDKSDEFTHKIKILKPSLIIAADGQDSVINDLVFTSDNKVVYSRDYLLQIDYTLDHNRALEGEDLIDEYSNRDRGKVIARESVGRFNGENRLVLLSVIAAKKEFIYHLQNSKDQKNIRFGDAYSRSLRLEAFIKDYREERAKLTLSEAEKQMNALIKMTLGKYPIYCATLWKEPSQSSEQIPVVLVGEAGLSYHYAYVNSFNDQIAATTKLMETMKTSIQQSANPLKLSDMRYPLSLYQDWFTREFIPSYLTKWSKQIKQAIEVDIISPRFMFRSRENTLKRIRKIFIDFVRPYKTTSQIGKDFAQPFFGFIDFWMGFWQMAKAVWHRDGSYFLDGLINSVFGVVEMLSLVFAWTLKPFIRAIFTGIDGMPNVESSPGIQAMANEQLALYNDKSTTPRYDKLLEVCDRVHDKFEKACAKGQATEIYSKEHAAYHSLSWMRKDDRKGEHIPFAVSYLSLFKKPEVNKLPQPPSPQIARANA